MRCKNPGSIRYALVVERVIQMLYGGLRLRDTESIQANTNSQVFLGTTRMRQQWCPPRPFFSSPAVGIIRARLAGYPRRRRDWGGGGGGGGGGGAAGPASCETTRPPSPRTRWPIDAIVLFSILRFHFPFFAAVFQFVLLFSVN